MKMKLKIIGAFALASTAIAFNSASAAELNIVSWGGAYTMSQNKAYHEPWTQKTGTKINNIDDAANGLAGLRAQVRAGNVTWDLLDILEGDAMLACADGIAEEIDYDEILAPAPDGTPASLDFVGGLNGCFIPQIVYSTLMAYNTESFPGKKPTSMVDVFDLKNFPGKRGLEKKPDGNLEWALIADGVPASQVYDVLSTPEGVSRAFKKLDTIKDSVVWWSAGAQPPQLLADKEVTISSGYNGRFFNAQVNENQPFAIIWRNQVFELDGWVVPVGKLNDEVKAYLRFATDTQRLADQAKYISYGPARKSSAPLVSTHAELGIDMKPHMPTNPRNFIDPVVKNAEWWADNGDEMRERFNAWLAR